MCNIGCRSDRACNGLEIFYSDLDKVYIFPVDCKSNYSGTTNSDGVYCPSLIEYPFPRRRLGDLDDFRAKRKAAREETDGYEDIEATVHAAWPDDELEMQRMEKKMIEIEKEIAEQKLASKSESINIMDHKMDNGDDKEIMNYYKFFDDNSKTVILVLLVISVIINIKQKANSNRIYKQISMESENEYDTDGEDLIPK